MQDDRAVLDVGCIDPESHRERLEAVEVSQGESDVVFSAQAKCLAYSPLDKLGTFGGMPRPLRAARLAIWPLSIDSSGKSPINPVTASSRLGMASQASNAARDALRGFRARPRLI